MKRFFLFNIILLLSLLVPTTAQEKRGWEKGPLTWADFAPMDQSIGPEHSYLEYILDVERRNDVVNGIELQSRTAVLYVDRKMSWVDTHYRTSQQLHYNQVAFNLAELHRRRLQLVIDTGGAVNMDYYTRLLTYMVDSFCHQTYYGADTQMVAFWEQDVRRKMDSITPLMVEQHQKANTIEKIIPQWSMAFNIGGGAKVFAGEQHKLFAPSGGMYFDFEGSLWRNLFAMGFYIGGGRCLPDSIEAVDNINKLYASDKISTIDFYINYGFITIDRRKWSLTPFVGYGMQAFLYDEGDGTSSNGPSEGCWRVGIDVKYHMANDETYYRTQLEQFLLSAHGKVYLTFDRYRDLIGTPTGVTINAQVGFSLGIKQSKLRRAATKKN
ncbi:MAG: hypothetical protein IJK84_06360 [Bacteroidales bacterium]|nr:hypothetical protein [Bacteroidales bacterium]